MKTTSSNTKNSRNVSILRVLSSKSVGQMRPPPKNHQLRSPPTQKKSIVRCIAERYSLTPKGHAIMVLISAVFQSLATSLNIQTKLTVTPDIEENIKRLNGSTPKAGRPRSKYTNEIYTTKNARIDFLTALQATTFLRTAAQFSTDVVYHQPGLKKAKSYWLPSVSVVESAMFPVTEITCVPTMIRHIHSDLQLAKGTIDINVDHSLLLNLIVAAVIHAITTENLTEDEAAVVISFLAVYSASGMEVREMATTWFSSAATRTFIEIETWWAHISGGSSDTSLGGSLDHEKDSEHGEISDDGDSEVSKSEEIVGNVLQTQQSDQGTVLVAERSLPNLSRYAAVYKHKTNTQRTNAQGFLANIDKIHTLDAKKNGKMERPVRVVPRSLVDPWLSIFNFVVKDTTGAAIGLEKYRDKVLIVVNVDATSPFSNGCYQQLNRIHEKYYKNGLRLALFPCNLRGDNEPCQKINLTKVVEARFHTKPDVYAEVKVFGTHTDTFWRFLKQEQGGQHLDVSDWIFTKFVIDRDGLVVGKFSPTSSFLDFEKHIDLLMSVQMN